MKKAALLLVITFGVLLHANAKTTTATSSGNWTAAIWDNGAPASGDIINIPAGIIVDITGNRDLRGAATTVINIDGTLRFYNFASLRLNDGDGDAVNISSTGSVTNGNALGGFITFGASFPFTPAISISAVGIISTEEGYIGPGPISGPSSISGGVLPIELISFEASVATNQVNFKWVTASELNNDFFTLERFDDSDRFHAITTLPGKGTTNEMSIYEAVDNCPQLGKNYYRLKQTDFDGTYSYSDVVMVEFSGMLEPLAVYPNPLFNEPLTIDLKNALPEGLSTIQIIDSRGAEAFRTLLPVDPTGFARETLDANFLTPGIYYVRVGEYSQKLVVQ